MDRQTRKMLDGLWEELAERRPCFGGTDEKHAMGDCHYCNLRRAIERTAHRDGAEWAVMNVRFYVTGDGALGRVFWDEYERIGPAVED